MKTYRVAATLRPFVCLCITAFALGACGGGGSDDASRGGTAAPSPQEGGNAPDNAGAALDDGAAPPSVPEPDAAARVLERRLVTAYADASNHESWVCLGEDWQTEYLLRIGTSGERFGEARDPEGLAAPEPLDWAAVGADTLLLDHRDLGRQVELSAILFGGPDAFRANGSVHGALECRRQRYVDDEPTRDVSGAVPIDVDREAEAALVLEARVQTRYVDATRFDFWLCTCEDEAPLRYLFGGIGVFGEEPIAKLSAENEPLEAARLYRWAAIDGSTLALAAVDEGANVGAGTDGSIDGVLSLGAIVFPVDGALAATRGDGASMQCVLRTRGS